jgi:hypothetical protein
MYGRSGAVPTSASVVSAIVANFPIIPIIYIQEFIKTECCCITEKRKKVFFSCKNLLHEDFKNQQARPISRRKCTEEKSKNSTSIV